jgi:hypothetical protein
MIRIGKLTAICSLVAILACSSLAGTEPNDANTPLTFEISPVEWLAPDMSYDRPEGGKPVSWRGTIAYVAGVPYKKDAFLPSDTMDFLRSQASSLDISEKQRSFLRGLYAGVDAEMQRRNTKRRYTPPEDPNSVQVMLYAVSLDDAKKMAQAFVQYTQECFKQRVADRQAHIPKMAEKIAEMQRRLPELAQSEETTRKALEEAKKQVPYRSVQQALDAAGELDKLLNTAQVEMAGIQATLKAIQDRIKALVTANLVQGMKEKLDVMFMEQSILLKATEARKRMATELRKQADTYMDLMEALPRVTEERESLRKYLEVKSHELQQAQGDYSLLLQGEPRVLDNRVFIHPVKERPAGNQ